MNRRCAISETPLGRMLASTDRRPDPLEAFRIARRFDTMLLAGFVDEVIELRKRYRLDPKLPSMRCVGYRQALEFLDGAYDRLTFRDKGVFATRQLAKRQLTWQRNFRENWGDLVEVDCLAAGMEEQVREIVERGL